MHYDLLLKLLAAHFISDFLLQPGSSVAARNREHYRAWQLYVHGVITALTVLFICGADLWGIALILGASHIILDGAKSYLQQNTFNFLADQALHLVILTTCWYFYSGIQPDWAVWKLLYDDPKLWLYLCGVLFLTTPSGFLVEMLTTRWRSQLGRFMDETARLEKAGMLIGILERLLIFLMVIIGKFEAIGLLIAAKSLLRFNEKERPEAKTEYLLVGTLISVALAVGAGFLVLNIHF